MMIQILHFQGCPNHDRTLALVHQIARELDVAAEVDVIEVADHVAATAHGFLGSPTVRVAGRDIEPAARTRTDFALACRRYGNSGVPPDAMIRAALIEEAAA